MLPRNSVLNIYLPRTPMANTWLVQSTFPSTIAACCDIPDHTKSGRWKSAGGAQASTPGSISVLRRACPNHEHDSAAAVVRFTHHSSDCGFVLGHMSYCFLRFFKKFCYSWLTVFCQFLLYSKVTQLYIHWCIYLFFTLPNIMSQHKWLDTVPCAIQQDLTAYQLFSNLVLLIPNFLLHEQKIKHCS